MTPEQQSIRAVDTPNKTPLWKRQIKEILKIERKRKRVAGKLAKGWNKNIGSAHEKCTVEDAEEALKVVEEQARQDGKKLKPFLYKLNGLSELRSIIIKRERKKFAESLSGIYYSGFSLPELPDAKTAPLSQPSKLTKIAESGFQLPNIEAKTEPKRKISAHVRAEAILFTNKV